MTDSREVTLFDIADWLWSYRLLAMALLLVAGLWAGISAYTAPWTASSQQYEVHVRIFPGGSPLRGISDISSIIITRLTKNEAVELTSQPDENPMIFKTNGAKQAEAVVLEAAELGAALTKEVGGHVSLLEPLIATNDSAVTPYLMAKDFLAGTDSGMFELISAESVLVSNNGTAPSILRAVMFPVIVCGVAFFVLALGTSFVRAWRQRKIQRA